jgi:hypothetical protein
MEMKKSNFQKRQAHFATSLPGVKTKCITLSAVALQRYAFFRHVVFFYRRKVLPSVSFGYASYLLRVGSVVSVCQFFLKDARQRVCSVVVLVGIKVAQKRRYMLIETLVPLFPTERHYN